MKFLRSIVNPFFLVLLILSFTIIGCGSGDETVIPSITTTETDGTTSVDDAALDDVLDTLSADDLSVAETDGLLFMREEEKLAHDVYIKMFMLGYPAIFEKISNSEHTHTNAILTLLDRYNVPDPVGNNPEGVFVDPYLQNLYDDLIVLGAPSLTSALSVGAEIEEIDLIDIQRLADALEGNRDILIVYENLMKGSRNHLRAFVGKLAKEGVDYAPRHLSQEEYDAVINAAIETN